MRKISIIFFFALFGFFFFTYSSFQTEPKKEKNFCLSVINDMNDSSDKVKFIRYHVKALEKCGDKYLSAESDIKIETSPRKIYLKNPEKKIEMLYREGEHGNDALVKPPGFPYTSLYLNPYGSQMRKNQHYTIFELGFGFIAKTMRSILSKDPKNAQLITNLGIVNKFGQNCYMFMYDNKEFAYYDYKTTKGESVSTIATKKFLSDYMIRNKNNLSSYEGSIKEGTIIKLPNNYCKKAILFVSEKTKLPVAINLYDEKEIWESYEFSNVITNKPIDNAEFLKTWKDYKF